MNVVNCIDLPRERRPFKRGLANLNIFHRLIRNLVVSPLLSETAMYRALVSKQGAYRGFQVDSPPPGRLTTMNPSVALASHAS